MCVNPLKNKPVPNSHAKTRIETVYCGECYRKWVAGDAAAQAQEHVEAGDCIGYRETQAEIERILLRWPKESP